MHLTKTERRSFSLIVANGALFIGAGALFGGNTVLPAFVMHLSGSAILVGAVSAM